MACSTTPNTTSKQAQVKQGSIQIQVQVQVGTARPLENTAERVNDARPADDAEPPRIESEHYPETAPEALGGVVAGAPDMVYEKSPILPTTRAQWLEAFRQVALHSEPRTIAFFRVET